MAPSAATKAAVAAMMKLPKQERIDRLMAMSTECIARQEDAAPFLELIQMELDTPDAPAAASRPSSAADAQAERAKSKAKRRELTAKRNELRAMLAKVDARERSLKPASEASRAAYAAAAPAAHESEEGKVLSHPRAQELMRKAQTNPRLMKALEDVRRSGPAAMAKYSNDPDVMEVVRTLDAIRQSIDGARTAAAAPSAAAPSAAAEAVGPMPTGLFVPGCARAAADLSPGKSTRASPRGQTSLGGALGARTLGSHEGRAAASASAARGDVDALLRKAEGGITGLGGGKASSGYSRARGSSGIFM